MRDAVDAVEPRVVPPAQVTGDRIDLPGILPVECLERSGAEKEPVDHTNAVAPFEKLPAKLEADIAPAARDQNVHHA